MVKYSAARWLESQDLAAPGEVDACLSCHAQPLVTTLLINYFRRKEEVSSRPNSDGPGFGFSEQRPPQLEAPLSESPLLGQRGTDRGWPWPTGMGQEAVALWWKRRIPIDLSGASS